VRDLLKKRWVWQLLLLLLLLINFDDCLKNSILEGSIACEKLANHL
jgi:hypothetical protein